MEDKCSIGKFLGYLRAPLNVDGEMQDISDLNILGHTNWYDLNRYDLDYWNLGIRKLCSSLKYVYGSA